MSLNYDYAIDLALRLAPHKRPSLLDYGCGAGEIVEKALAAGLDAHGVETFYEGGSYREAAQRKGLLGTHIHELEVGKIPFPDASFEVVISNQVFEHIEDLALPMSEIRRVLKPGGLFINMFPTAEIWREGHIGIPFAHWFPKGNRWRYYYVLPLRKLGLGSFKGSKTASQWTRDQLEWIDRWTHYRSCQALKRTFEEHFSVSLYDADYMKYRIKHHPKLVSASFLFEAEPVQPLLGFLCAKLASHVFVMTKNAP